MTLPRSLAALLALATLSACAAPPMPLEKAAAPIEAEAPVELALGCGIPGQGDPEGPDDGIGGTGCPAM